MTHSPQARGNGQRKTAPAGAVKAYPKPRSAAGVPGRPRVLVGRAVLRDVGAEAQAPARIVVHVGHVLVAVVLVAHLVADGVGAVECGHAATAAVEIVAVVAVLHMVAGKPAEQGA